MAHYKNKIKVCHECGKDRPIPANRKTCSSCRQRSSAVKKGEILPPTYTDTTYAPYKQPMVFNSSGFGFFGAVVQSSNGSHIQCNECGYFYKNLAGHITNFHKINIREYKMAYGLRIRQGLISPQYREEVQHRFNELPIRQDQLKNVVLAHEAIRKKREEGQQAYTAKEGGTWLAQLRNERGQCADQLIEKIKQLGERLGRAPGANDFDAEYGGGMRHSVKTLHGSWSEALTKAGYPTWEERKKDNIVKRKEDAAEKIRAWYERNGRTPQNADFKSDPRLPNVHQVLHDFGGLNLAREAANVPQLKNLGNGIWAETKGD